MKTTDLYKTTSSKLNESLEKTFGKKLKLETFSNEQLEDARNKLRTQVHQVRSNSAFNENLENEAYLEAQWMLDAINAEILEREEQVAEGIQEGARSLDSETVEAIIKLKEVYMDKGMEPEEAQDEAAEAFGIDPEELADYLDSQYDNDDFDFRQEYDDDPMDDMMDSIERNENLVTESEVDEASAIVTAKTMVDKVGRWIEELSGMENDTLLSLGDSIRDQMGSEKAKQFISSTAPAIQDALSHLKDTRDTMATSLRVLTGEESGVDMLGDVDDEADVDIDMDVEPDTMNLDIEEPEDEFGAAEPAAGGIEAAGRAKRESIDRGSNLMKILAG